jgi:hypothetical protein
VTVIAVTLFGTTKVCAAPLNLKVFKCFVATDAGDITLAASIAIWDPVQPASKASAMLTPNRWRIAAKVLMEKSLLDGVACVCLD